MSRGRPSYSVVREHIKEILFVFGSLTAYDIYSHYKVLFAKTSMRNVYYQCERGVSLEVFDKKTVEEKGSFSWGSVSRKVYYSLNAKDGVNPDSRVFEYANKHKGEL
ncbi:MAG: hypothetical protein ACQESC_01120 [Nanobdellota archaeon]